tara:strand:+ start:441 stop:947 length:507 start_codon:yes stop_codon:yes gene_type:complete
MSSKVKQDIMSIRPDTCYTLQETLELAISNTPEISEQKLDDVLKTFRSKCCNEYGYKSYTDLDLCKSVSIPFNKILTCNNVNSNPDLFKIIKIIESFQECYIKPVDVFEHKLNPGFYIHRNGMHTTLVLYLILTKVFDESADLRMVPCVVHSSVNTFARMNLNEKLRT